MGIATERPAGNGKVSALLPDDEVFVLTINDAKIEVDEYAKPEADGTKPEKLVITWELEAEDITRKQKRMGVEAGKRIWQRLALFYYVKEDGMPTQLKAVLDALDGRENGEGLIFTVDVAALYEDPGMLVGIKAPCRVEQYAKTKGARKGEFDNRIAKVRTFEEEEGEDEEAPAPAAAPARPAAAARGAVPPKKNAPRPVHDDDVPF